MDATTVTSRSALNGAGDVIDSWPAAPLQALGGEYGRLRCRFLNAGPEGPRGSWLDFVISEWELTSCGWEDWHPHSETAFVLEGELHVRSEGQTVILHKGDSARVNAGHLGEYIAPEYARMISIYGPNPDGLESNSFRYYEL